jgi:hypothetical protein
MKQKEIKLPMKFNPGLKKYEPELPLKKSDKKVMIKFNWIKFLLILLGIIAMGVLFYLLYVFLI